MVPSHEDSVSPGYAATIGGDYKLGWTIATQRQNDRNYFWFDSQGWPRTSPMFCSVAKRGRMKIRLELKYAKYANNTIRMAIVARNTKYRARHNADIYTQWNSDPSSTIDPDLYKVKWQKRIYLKGSNNKHYDFDDEEETWKAMEDPTVAKMFKTFYVKPSRWLKTVSGYPCDNHDTKTHVAHRNWRQDPKNQLYLMIDHDFNSDQGVSNTPLLVADVHVDYMLYLGPHDYDSEHLSSQIQHADHSPAGAQQYQIPP